MEQVQAIKADKTLSGVDAKVYIPPKAEIFKKGSG